MEKSKGCCDLGNRMGIKKVVKPSCIRESSASTGTRTSRISVNSSKCEVTGLIISHAKQKMITKSHK